MKENVKHRPFTPARVLPTQVARALGVALALGILALVRAPTDAHAADPEPTVSPPANSSAGRPEGGAGSDDKTRNFYDVLEDVMGDFEYDLKNGAVSGIKDLSIRNIATSENIPPSFKSHLELLVTERILRTSKTRMIQCAPCRAKKTIVKDDQVIISSPDNNPADLARVAKLSGIANFMDISFSYQPSGIVLSMFTVEPETGAIIWSRSYNSETSRASAFRRGVDFNQVDEARKQTEYQPMVQYRAMIYYLFEPNVGTTTGTLGFGIRMMERYDNRKKEVGFELNYLMDSSTVVGGTAAAGAPPNLYGSVNFTLLFMHAWNFIGAEENFNRVRGSFFGGVGGTYASGYLGGLVRSGYEWRLGKHYAVTPTLGFRPSSTVFVSGTPNASVGGVEFGVSVNMLF